MTYLYSLIAVFIATTLMTTQLYAGEPTDQIRETTSKLLAILTDPALKNPEMEQEKRRLVRKTVDERFDWVAISRRAVGRHWKKMTEEEKKEFTYLFGKLLERTYMDKVGSYSGETVSYEKEKVDGKYAVIYVKILTEKYGDISVKYRVWNRKGKWLIYDISVEGVSLVNNYRSQFNSILMKSSPQELIQRLREKVGEV